MKHKILSLLYPNRRLRGKTGLIVLILFIINFIVLSTYPIKVVSAKQTFPDSFGDITYLKYSFNQKFIHYSAGLHTAGGNIKVMVSKTNDNLYNITLDHDLSVWIRKCSDPHSFYYKIQYRVDPNSRKILYVDNASVGFDKDIYLNNYSYYFINTKGLQNGDKEYIRHDDLIIFRGAGHSSLFRYMGVDTVYIQGQPYDAVHMQFSYDKDSVLVYDGSVCGLGSGILINATVDLYYEVKCGVLLYSKSSYLEYYYLDSQIWERHEITRTIQDINYINEPANNDGFIDPDKVEYGFWSDIENRIGVLSIVGIITITLFGIYGIKRRAFRWKVEALKRIDNIEQKLVFEIKQLRKELNLEDSQTSEHSKNLDEK